MFWAQYLRQAREVVFNFLKGLPRVHRVRLTLGQTGWRAGWLAGGRLGGRVGFGRPGGPGVLAAGWSGVRPGGRPGGRAGGQARGSGR